MFRTQVSDMESAVVRATDENLTDADWSKILDVCDRVGASPSGPSQAVGALIKRLAHRNANVQLYALELGNALSQNCGPELHREIASKAFTDALLRLAGDRNTHGQVKQKVLERMGSWTEMFKGKHDLGIMEQAYNKLRMTQPGLMPPSKPVKSAISSDDRRKEEEELQMALALSVQDAGKTSGPPQANGTVGDDSQPQPAQAASGAQAQGTTAATVSRVRALYDFAPSEAGELAFKKGDIIAVLESVYKDWWKGSLRGQTGIFPLNYVEKLQDPTKEELEKDATMESEVFGEVRNVEKLLALLSVEGGGRRGEREEDEIAELYQRTLGVRPKLVELIGKYSQKKEDFTQLNEKFIKARRDYEALLESSMSQPQHYQQQYPIRNRQSSYPPQQQPPYGGQLPPAGYPPQGPPAGYQPYPGPSQSSSHLPPPQNAQQDPQRFYSPAPSEPPSQAGPGQGQGYSSPYPPSGGPSNGPAPFHFIPGGAPGPSPDQAIRRKPSPAALAQQANEPYSAGPPGFQGQIRPNSIHTLNSGNPQELATGGYESPIDNRHSYPSAQHFPPQSQPPQGGYDPYAQPPPQQHGDINSLPSRQRTMSFESPTSAYSQQPDGGQFVPHQPSAPPPGPPQAQGGYQAYQPPAAAAGGDPGDYYR